MKLRRTVAASSTPPPRGFPRWAWWAVVLATLTFAVPLTSPWWSKVLRGEIPDGAEEDGEGPSAATNAGASPEAAVVPGSTLKVVLHTRFKDKPGLVTVDREVPYIRGVVPQIVAAVSELSIASADAAALLPLGTRVLDVAFSPGGTAYIDFSAELDLGRGVGAFEEKFLVEGIVTTITDNFTAVRRVVILVEGKVPKAGHLDLSRSLRRDDPIFAAEEEPQPEVTPPAVKPGRVVPSGSTSPGPAASAQASPKPKSTAPSEPKPAPTSLDR